MPFSELYKNLLLNSQGSNYALALFNGVPGDTGVEVTGAGYARKAVTLTGASGGERRLSADVIFGVATSGSWTQATHAALFLSGQLISWAPLTAPFTVTTTASLSFAANSTDLRLRITDA